VNGSPFSGFSGLRKPIFGISNGQAVPGELEGDTQSVTVNYTWEGAATVRLLASGERRHPNQFTWLVVRGL